MFGGEQLLFISWITVWPLFLTLCELIFFSFVLYLPPNRIFTHLVLEPMFCHVVTFFTGNADT